MHMSEGTLSLFEMLRDSKEGQRAGKKPRSISSNPFGTMMKQDLYSEYRF